MIPDAEKPLPRWPVVAASIWGYIVLSVAWTMAEQPRTGSYLQLGVPFTIALIGLLTDSRRWRLLSLWIAGWGSSIFAAAFLVNGVGLLVLPSTAVYLWTAWQWNKQGRHPHQT